MSDAEWKPVLLQSEMERAAAAPLFNAWQETLIWSALQGVMGRVWADDAARPTVAQVWTGDFCFLAGDANHPRALALTRNIPADYATPWMVYTGQTTAWEALIERAYPGAYAKRERFAFRKEPDAFDTVRLQAFVDALPEGFSLRPIDATLYACLLSQGWSRDFCSQFASGEAYEKRGLGFVVCRGDEIVGGASSYAVYNGGIEIEIHVQEAYRRMGLATACAARLILACLARGLYPSWDASNPNSVGLAEKLGYRLAHPYTAYVIDRKRI